MFDGEPILSPGELNDNQKRKSKLISLINSKDSILMAGAGCSGAIYPPWGEFVRLLDGYVKRHDPEFSEDSRNFLNFADKAKESLGDGRYYSFIYQQFKPKKGQLYNDIHSILCRLPFKAITTTNYDVLLESALIAITKNPDSSLCFEGENKVKIYEFLASLNPNSAITRRVIHLHGKFDINNSIILGGKEYALKYGFTITTPTESLFEQIQQGNIDKEKFQDLLLSYGYEWPIRRKLLWTLLATRRIVFFGFSMSDPYFIKMLEFVKEYLSTYEADTHYVVLRITQESKKRSFDFAQRLKNNYGIETVFFEDNNKFEGLEKFVQELGNEILGSGSKMIPENVVEDTKISSDGNQDLTNELFELTKKLD